MKKIRIIPLIIPILCAAVIYMVLQNTVYYPWVILPVKSTPHTLTLVKYGGSWIQKVTLKHYVSDDVVCDYVLKLDVPLGEQVPQEYELPMVKKGRIEIRVEFDDAVLADGNKQIKVTYDNADSLYEKGVLIYSEGNLAETHTIDGYVYYDQYMHFISGEEQVTHKETAGELKWKPVNNAPKPKDKTPKFLESYIPIYDGWKEKNRWIILRNRK